MSRLKTADKAQTTYQGAAKSVGFNPQQAASEAADTQQLKQAIVADGETISREIQRVQSAENTVLQAQQEIERSGQRKDASSESAVLRANQALEQSNLKDNQLFDRSILEQQQTYEKGKMALDMSALRASQAADSARTKVIGTSINSMLSFAGSAVSYRGQQIKANEVAEAKKLAEIENQQLNNAALGGDFFSGAGPSPEVVANGSANDAAYTADSQAIGDAAADIASGGTAEDSFVSEQVQGMGAWNQTADARANVYAARTQYPAFLAEAQANGLIRPGAEGYSDIQRLTSKFAKATGLGMADPKLVAEVFSRSALGTAQNTLTAVTNQAAGELKKAREGKINSNISVIADGLGASSSTAELGEAWERANTENVNGIHNGRRGTLSTRDTTEKFLRELAAEGKSGQIDRLRGYEYNPSRKGATLGGEFDDLFDKYEKQASKTATSNFNAIQAEKKVRTQQALSVYMDNPSAETRQEAVNALMEIGSVDALQQADRISKNGMNIDPAMELELRQRTANGNPPTPAEIRTLLDQKIITDEVAKEYLETPEQKAATKAVKGYSSGVSAGLKQSMLGGTLSSGDLDANMKGQWTIRHQMMMRELNDMVSAEVAANPSIAEDPQRLAQTFDKSSKFLLSQDRYQIDDNIKTGKGFKAPIVSDKNLAIITTTQGNQDWSGYSAEQIFSGGTFPRSEMQAGKDTFVPIDSLKSDVKSIMEGGEPSNRTRLIAKNLGLSPRALVEEQLKLQGLPSVQFMKNLETSTVAPPAAGTDLNMKTGFSALQSLGVPRIGAAYLAGNIQQESTWNGMRQWGQVSNPSDGGRGDGTNRNGGLVSWASWSSNSARLGAIERHFGGRNIAKITETEQLDYMLNVEMKKSYPQAYSVFMNPNSSAAALKKASYAYWGFGHQGKRYNHAEQLLAGG